MQTVVLDVATQLSGVTRGDSEQRAPQLAPRAYLRGKKILSEADKTLNNFQVSLVTLLLYGASYLSLYFPFCSPHETDTKKI